MSLGSFLKSPTSFTTLVKANMKMNCVQKAYLWDVGSQLAVPFQSETRSSGSTTKARDVKVAICKAYVHQGCCLKNSHAC